MTEALQGYMFYEIAALLALAAGLVLDALGLGVFAVSGSQKSLLFGLDPLPAILLWVLTAVGGGAVRDLLVAEIPRVLREEVYALAAMVGAVIVVAGAALGLPETWTAAAGVVAAFGILVISVWRCWRAPRAPGS
ncbi:trimeric intracellular cation channel family protein [Histidinibacterium aquaticum]|uniref:trimeric intracellular cation channel family protein n=1 Tax=Histidinibacterium aquaticum TaxID=2613962 RepID=UPI001CC3FEA8|nr:TRIC cation channel family protein [Histidinibacterium aquaticum]